jgi:hypothetical protein
MVTDGDACCQQAFLRRNSFDYVYRTYDLHSVRSHPVSPWQLGLPQAHLIPPPFLPPNPMSVFRCLGACPTTW